MHIITRYPEHAAAHRDHLREVAARHRPIARRSARVWRGKRHPDGRT